VEVGAGVGEGESTERVGVGAGVGVGVGVGEALELGDEANVRSGHEPLAEVALLQMRIALAGTTKVYW